MILALFGLGMFALGGIMLVKPIAFANGISEFSSKSWFHNFEIASRLIVGLLFIWQSKYSAYPVLFLVLGIILCFVSIILCFVSIFLVLVGSKQHKRFAILTSKIGVWFRPLGVFALSAGCVLMYLGFLGEGV
ncbi:MULTISPECIES: hypothetical protein [Pseudoalteromonas]|uniref:DUF4149 domain-containing protein n=1 Tax=Pseudoalteromonas amylolytica TaxID=1859457 RepID=A0A1S1MZ68_9GAMM|nr:MULTISPECIES: hypothetical protein [Pseudoalteromonas]OHU85334.1 hypothetical protein BFC16_18425 [Pseudoalteromonas sp. JW3]OHU93044.1 hypothetical protein BET10_03290 [Pseudoalteromonas amylolytica]